MKLKDIFTPKALSGLAVVGVVGTAVLAAIEGMASKEKLEEIRANVPEDKKDSKLAVSTYYIPRVAGLFWKTIVVGGTTIVCIVASCCLSGLQLAAAAGTVSYLVTQRSAIEKEVSKLPGGKEALAKAKAEVAKATAIKKIEEDEKKKPWTHQSIEETGLGDKLCMDLWSGRLFRCDPDAVLKAWEEFNTERDEGMDLPFSDDHEENFPIASSYNDIYTKLNLEPIGLYSQYGYPANDDYYATRSIPVEIEHLKFEDMDELKKAKYGEDLYILKYPDEYSPMECWLEV